MTVKADISYGELLDKISILEIKLEHATDPAQRANIENELNLLVQSRDGTLDLTPEARDHAVRLKDVNRRLWAIEDDIRDCERRGDFGADFVSLARSVYKSNDERAAIKRALNECLGSPLVEEKLYQDY